MQMADKAMAVRLQEDRIRIMKQKEDDDKKRRYEWRKNCESSYDRQMQEIKKKMEDEKLDIRTGPTTIGALGSHYEQ